MKTERVFEIVNSIRPGTVFRIEYKTDLPLKSVYKKQGMSISKYVSKLTRTGVKYTHISGVVPSDSNRKSYVESVVANRIYQHIENKTYYLRLACWKNSNYKAHYVINFADGSHKEISEEDLHEYVINSYWNKSGEVPAVINVKFDNILSICGEVK